MARQNELTIKEIKRETTDTVSISFDVPKELEEDYKFIPGQYLTLRAEIEGQDIEDHIQFAQALLKMTCE